MLISVKRSVLWSLIVILAIIILMWSLKPVEYHAYVGERISDNYKRDAVISYEVFESSIQGHALMLVHLKTGECFPMICRKTPTGITTIPQSVFVIIDQESWNIMCEPNIGGGFYMMMIPLTKKGDDMQIGDNKLKRSSDKLQLI